MLQPAAVAGWITAKGKPRGRDEEFQSIFNIPDEKVLDDFACACQTNQDRMLRQGRMYLTENYVAFYSLIIGAYTKLIRIDEIEAMNKKNTAYVVPNAIEIVVGDIKYFFGSFIFRDRTYDRLAQAFKNKTGKNIDDVSSFQTDSDEDTDIAGIADDTLAVSPPSSSILQSFSSAPSSPSSSSSSQPASLSTPSTPSSSSSSSGTDSQDIRRSNHVKPIVDTGLLSIGSTGSLDFPQKPTVPVVQTPSDTSPPNHPHNGNTSLVSSSSLSPSSSSSSSTSSIAQIGAQLTVSSNGSGSSSNPSIPGIASSVTAKTVNSLTKKIVMSPGYFPYEAEDLKGDEAKIDVPQLQGRAQLISSDGSPSSKRRPKSTSFTQVELTGQRLEKKPPPPSQLGNDRSQQQQQQQQRRIEPIHSSSTPHVPHLSSSSATAQITITPPPSQQSPHPQTQPQSSPPLQQQASQLPSQIDLEAQRLIAEEKRTDEQMPPLGKGCKHFSEPQSALMFDEPFNVSIKEFFINFMLEENTRFLLDFHQSIDYTENEVDKWMFEEEGCCLKREARFRVPLKTTLGPKSTRIAQTQRVRLKSPNHMLFTTSSLSKDVPYGDSFLVDSKWSISSPTPQDYNCRLKLAVEVRFTKSVWIKGLIEKNVMESTKEYFGAWIAYARAKESAILQTRQDRLVKLNLHAKAQLKPQEILPNISEAAIQDHSQQLLPASSADIVLPSTLVPPTLDIPISTSEIESGVLHRVPSFATVKPSSSSLSVNSLSISGPASKTVQIPFTSFRVDLTWLIFGSLLLFLMLFGLSMQYQLSSVSSSLEFQTQRNSKLELRLSFLQMMMAAVTQNTTGNSGYLREEWSKFGQGKSTGFRFADNLLRWRKQIVGLQRELEHSRVFLDRIGEQLDILGSTNDEEEVPQSEEGGRGGGEGLDLGAVMDGTLEDFEEDSSGEGREGKSKIRSTATSTSAPPRSAFWWWVERILTTAVSVAVGFALQSYYRS